jgi:hypothetical protein
MPRIACTLSGTELPQRLAEIRALGREALLSVEREQARAVLRFKGTPTARTELRRIVAAESRCCAFLDLELTEEPEVTVLAIAAPAGAEPVMHELVEAFAAEAA